jgi:hypothetical protein
MCVYQVFGFVSVVWWCNNYSLDILQSLVMILVIVYIVFLCVFYVRLRIILITDGIGYSNAANYHLIKLSGPCAKQCVNYEF